MLPTFDLEIELRQYVGIMHSPGVLDLYEFLDLETRLLSNQFPVVEQYVRHYPPVRSGFQGEMNFS